MSEAVLTYYLKNRDSNVRLGFQLALQCAPFLKKLKVSCVISVKADLYQKLEHLFDGSNIEFCLLSCQCGKCLVLFYRREEMEAYLNQPEIQQIIQIYGYSGMEFDGMLEYLKFRIKYFKDKEMGFPHEIGVFLGYPPEDVKGFIENEGKRYLMTGYWKVYQNLSLARVIFKEFDRAKDCAVNEFLNGKSVREIAL